MIQAKLSMGAGIVLIAEASEAILGTFRYLLFVLGGRVYVCSSDFELLAAKESIGR